MGWVVSDIELEVSSKNDVLPIFCKPRPVPVSLENDLALAYEEVIAKGVWELTQFSEYGTPVVQSKWSDKTD